MDIAFPVVTEGEVRAFHHAPHAYLLAADAVEELPRREIEQPMPGTEDADLRGTGFLQQGNLTLRPDKRAWCLIGAQQGHRMGIERDRQRRQPRKVGLDAEAVQ